MTMDDENAIKDLARRQLTAWADGDGQAFADTFTHDADFIAANGELIQTREALALSMQEGFDGFMKGTRMSEAQHTHIRFPAPGTAVMITVGNCVLRDGATQCGTEDLSQQTRVAVRTDQGWLFTSFHNSRVRPRL